MDDTLLWRITKEDMISLSLKMNVLAVLLYVSVYSAILFPCFLFVRRMLGIRVNQSVRVLGWYGVLLGMLLTSFSAINRSYLWNNIVQHFNICSMPLGQLELDVYYADYQM